jgi:hypothetical protein
MWDATKNSGVANTEDGARALIAIQQCHGNTASDPRRAEAAKKHTETREK